MATHDYVIDNSTGANVRADINNVLQAILTNNSSSSAPSTTAAYMWWADTNAGVLKIRNSANNDWIELFQLDGTLTLEDGTNSAPALAFRDDLDTGIYSSAANTFNVATGGTERMELGTTTIFNEDGADVDFRIEGNNEANLFYVDAGNDRIGLSTASPRGTLDLGSGSGDGVLSNTPANYQLILEAPQSTTGDIGRNIAFVNSTNNVSAAINSFDGGTGVTNGLVFATASTGTLAECMRIDSAGRLLIGTTTEGHANGDDLTIATSGNTGLTIRSGTSSGGNIYFSDGTSGNDEFRGFISYGHDVNNMYFATEATTRLQINDIGNVEITTEVAANGDVGLQLDTNSTSNCSSLLFQAGGENRAQIQVQRVAGDGGYVALQVARTDNSNSLVNVFTATPSTSGDTTPDLTLAGNLVVSAGNGIDFSAQTTTSASGAAMENELLDHYEEGYWAPLLKRLNSGSEASFYTQGTTKGIYTRIGNVVFFTVQIVWSGGSTGSGSTVLTRLPFNPMTTGTNHEAMEGSSLSIGFRNGWNYPRLTSLFEPDNNRYRIQFVDASSPYGSFDIVPSAANSSGSFNCSGHYMTEV